jgi:hypothetical protein
MDQAIHKIEGFGEVGIDPTASPGNGQFYVRLYDGSYDQVGFDTEADARYELEGLLLFHSSEY